MIGTVMYRKNVYVTYGKICCINFWKNPPRRDSSVSSRRGTEASSWPMGAMSTRSFSLRFVSSCDVQRRFKNVEKLERIWIYGKLWEKLTERLTVKLRVWTFSHAQTVG